MPLDPVCGMEVEKEEAAGSSTYKGETYYFCSPHCKEEFDKNPEKYLKKKNSGELGRELHSRPNKSTDRSTTPVRADMKKSPLKDEAEGKKGERVDLPITGMSCASCAQTIQKGLSELQGVNKASVNLATSKATIFYEPEKSWRGYLHFLHPQKRI